MLPTFSAKEIAAFRSETTGCKHVIHLNNAGASLMPDVVTQSIQEHITLESQIGGYEAAALRSEDIAQFYVQAARLLNCKPSNIAFTSSATDSFSRALSSIPFQADDVILTDNDNFISNQIQFLSCQKRFGIRLVRVRNIEEGGIDLVDLSEKLDRLRPRLLAITHIPTNSGLVQPVKAIGDIWSRYAAANEGRAWYILDACQSIGQLKLDVCGLNCDFLSVTNRKFLRGPRGCGFLYVSDKALQNGLEPLFLDMRGAEWVEKDVYQPKESATRFEDWEFAYALVQGTRVAIEYCLNIGEVRIQQQVQALSRITRQGLSSIPRIRVLDKGTEISGLVTFTVDGKEPDHLVHELLKRHINVVPSYRNFAVIDFDEKKVQWAIRASPHYYNTPEEIAIFLDTVETMV
ncbi:MAG TPA: aminotransferase class V-fold PLP-dependent enzyme [Puia sp.]